MTTGIREHLRDASPMVSESWSSSGSRPTVGNGNAVYRAKQDRLVTFNHKMSEVCEMLLNEAQKYLEVVRKRGEATSELRRVYDNIAKNKELFLAAYANLYANKGAMTPGRDESDTVDGMSMKRIDTIIGALKKGRYTWKPPRRRYIPQKDGTSKRPLGMPGWNDKTVQEVIKMVLETYYEPQFRSRSHGFRPGRGCHTALSEVKNTWTGGAVVYRG